MTRKIFILTFFLIFMTPKLNSQEIGYERYPHIPTSLTLQMTYPATGGGTFCFSFARLVNPFISAETGDMHKFSLGNRWGI